MRADANVSVRPVGSQTLGVKTELKNMNSFRFLERGIEAEIASFFNDIPARLDRAHLVIARSGASTVAELCVVGRPAILVPYAHAADDHQSFNARALSEAGAAWVVPEHEFTPERLAALLIDVLSSPQKLTDAANAAHSLGIPDAAERLADLVGSYAEERAA